MIRKILSILCGYVIFVATSLLLFKLSKQNAHAEATLGFMIFTAVYGALFSFISGLITQLISKEQALRVNYILAFIIAGFAAFSFLKSTGSHWTQLLAIFLFAPVSILGGMFHVRRNEKIER